MTNINEYRIKGNEAFEKKNWEKAIGQYSLGINLLKDVVTKSLHVEKDSPGWILCILYANRSCAYSNIRSFKAALIDAEEIMKLRHDWPKGCLRKADALIGLCLYESAIEIIQKGLTLEPDSNVLRRKLIKAKAFMQDKADGLFVHQLALGKELGKKGWFSPIQNIIFDYGIQLKNWIYIIEHVESRQCIVVDACWDIAGILDYISQHGLTLVGAIITHYHIDHVGVILFSQ